MKIGVLVKNVPDTETKIKLTSDRSGIETQGIKYVMNPFDEYAVEAALQLKEKFKDDTTVTVMSLGPDRVVETLRTALAMGADEAVHVWDPAFEGSDMLSGAKILAKVAEKMEFDLILGGKQGIDYDSMQTCAAVAEHLGIPQVQIVIALEISDDKTSIVARRRIEGGDEVVNIKLPAVVTCEKGLNEPRYASLPGIMKAKKKEIKKIGLSDLEGLSAADVGASGSATKIVGYEPLAERAPCRMLEGEPGQQVSDLVRALREDAKVI
ncbi:MAG: electron transfer flavoprotein subunit beta/FixA family protein [Candidatus Latescibacterota bacterium]|nr:MAG: electron transfer flavoprotein subunit beta/FixA family protein [Candidatus Latescibacterota bacterium]